MKQSYMISAIATGFLTVGPLMPDELAITDEEAADMIAEIVKPTFEPRDKISSQELAELSQAFTQYSRPIDRFYEKAASKGV